MKHNIYTTPNFDRQFKVLAGKYASLKDDFKKALAEIDDNPNVGSPIYGNVRKIRMAIKSKGKGKSGGARIISLNIFAKKKEGNDIVLLYIYDKDKCSTISDNQIKQILKENDLE